MLWTKLIDFMVNFICDPEFFVVLGIVKDSLINGRFLELVDDFNFIEINQSTIWCSTRYIYNCIGLNADFHFDELLYEGKSEMESWFGECGLEHSKLFVDTNVTFLDFVETEQHCAEVRGNKGDNYVNDSCHFIICKICFINYQSRF